MFIYCILLSCANIEKCLCMSLSKKDDNLKCTNGGGGMGGGGLHVVGGTWVSKSILNDFATAYI